MAARVTKKPETEIMVTTMQNKVLMVLMTLIVIMVVVSVTITTTIIEINMVSFSTAPPFIDCG